MTDVYPIPRPKILTAITEAGNAFAMSISVATQYDTPIVLSLDAGTYYMAWDGQADDYLYHFNSKLYAAINAAVGWAGWEAIAYLDSNNHVVIAFDGDNYDATAAAPGFRRDVQIYWNATNSAIAAVLGFDSSSDATLTGANNPTTTSDWQHAYGWYATEDGQLENLLIENDKHIRRNVSRSMTGQTVSHRHGALEESRLDLAFIERDLMHSQDVAYATAPVYPYARNVPLECWWKEARNGTRFRVYRDGQMTLTRCIDKGTASASDNTSITDATKSWQHDGSSPALANRWVGRILYQQLVTSNNNAIPGRGYITDNDATSLTTNATIGSGAAGTAFEWEAAAYYVFEHPYDTFVLSEEMEVFAPTQIPNLDRFNISIPLWKYVA